MAELIFEKSRVCDACGGSGGFCEECAETRDDCECGDNAFFMDCLRCDATGLVTEE